MQIKATTSDINRVSWFTFRTGQTPALLPRLRTALGQSRRFERVPDSSASPPIAAVPLHRSERRDVPQPDSLGLPGTPVNAGRKPTDRDLPLE